MVKNSSRASRGIIVGARATVFDIIDSRTDKYSISVVHCISYGWTQMNSVVDGPNQAEYRQEFWEELCQIMR